MLSQARTVEYCLIQWAKWAYFNRGLKVYYPSISTIEKMRQPRRGDPALTDSEAEAVDRAVSMLGNESRRVHDALVLYYLCGMSFRKVGEELGVHHRTAADWIDMGKMYVKGALVFGAPFSA